LEEESAQRLIRFFKGLLRKRPQLSDESDLTNEIEDLIHKGRIKGLISGEESEMVYGVLDLKEKEASSIMIPRTAISAASIDSTLSEVIELIKECGHTRIPIYKENIDEIVGILHAKDLLKAWGSPPDKGIPKEIVRKPYFVPLNMNLINLLKALREKKTHLAIVTDEYGGTAGIVTIEDILEEIVGEIMDEHDNEPPLIEPVGEDAVLVDARLEIEKLEEYLNVKFPEGTYESVGGFVINQLGRIPKQGEEVNYSDLHMVIKSGNERRIGKILITRRPQNNPSN
jgi:magnesium and cobalt transporter